MVEKFGSDQSQLATFGGGVISEDGAVLLSGESNGESALLFGPTAVREVQAGVANGDMAITPADPLATITADNPLPYWTFTDVSSGGAITAAIVADAGAGSGNVLRFTIASGTLTNKSATLTRFIPVPSSASRSFTVYAEATFDTGTNSTQATAQLTCQFYKSDQTTTTGSSFSSDAYTFSQLQGATGITAPDLWSVSAPDPRAATAPADAAFLKVTITIKTVATQSAARTVDLTEVRVAYGAPELVLTDKTDPVTYRPAFLLADQGSLEIIAGDQNYISIGDPMYIQSPTISMSGATTINADLAVTGNIGFDGVIYGSSALTGIALNVGGTNNRLWIHSNPAADVAASTSTTVSGVLITKVTAGQPSTNINGTATTDAFADALRNGGIAVDTTNNRAYFYSSGWKYAALTTPSDSRLKEEITSISDALGKLKQLVPVAFKWKRPEAHARAEAVDDDGSRLGFIADQVATTDLKHWVETLGVDEREADLVDTTEVLAVNIPQNEIEALIVQALIDIDARITALESR